MKFKNWLTRKLDKKIDRIVNRFKLNLSTCDSGVIDYSLVNQPEINRLKEIPYPEFIERVAKIVQENNLPIKFVPVKDFDNPDRDFKTQPLGYRIYTLELGNPSASNKIVIEGTCHGGERIHSITCILVALSLCKEGALREKILQKSHISILPAADPLGWQKKTRAYVNMRGDETRNPVVVNMQHIRNLFGWSDANAVFGRNLEEAKSPRIRAIEKHFMEQFGPPTLYNSLHETVMFGSHLFYGNAGIMILIHHYFPEQVRDIIFSLRYALTRGEKIEKALRKFNPLAELKYTEEYLEYHPAFEKAKSIRNYIKRMGIRTFEDKFFRVEREFSVPGPKSEITIAESLLITGPLYVKAGIVLAPDYYEKMSGCVGQTIETFSQSESERIIQGAAFIDGSLRCEVLGEYYE